MINLFYTGRLYFDTANGLRTIFASFLTGLTAQQILDLSPTSENKFVCNNDIYLSLCIMYDTDAEDYYCPINIGGEDLINGSDSVKFYRPATRSFGVEKPQTETSPAGAVGNLQSSAYNCAYGPAIIQSSDGFWFFTLIYAEENPASGNVFISPSSSAFGNMNLAGGEYSIIGVSANNEVLGEALKSAEIDPDPFSPGGDTEQEGGEGDFDNTGDDIDFPSPPSLSAVDTGFITLFNPSLYELRDLASYMWSNLFDIATLKKLFADPMNCILGLSVVPVNVPAGAAIAVTVGNISTGVSMTTAASQYVTVDCGTLNINEYWGAYLDYSPFTKAEIYLPYCGIHPINIDDIMGKSVHVKYNVDILSGACCAMVKCGGSVLYSYIGQCAASIPISGNDWSTVINGVISAATAVGSMVATGGATAPLVMPGLASTAVNSMKPSVERSGAMGGTGGMMGIQKPYIVLTRPKQALPKGQNKYTGYPSFITEELQSLIGYTEVELIHLEGIPATESELSEIETILKSGVIL